MKCEKCNIDVNPTFKFAIEKNQCPGCGGSLMSEEQLSSLIAIKKLLSFTSNTNIDYIANLIVENFELKQKFKSIPKVDDDNKIETTFNVEQNVGSLENVGKLEVIEDEDPDKEYKNRQMAHARKLLKEQAYESALRSQYGMDADEDEDFFDDSDEQDPRVLADKMKTEFKRADSANKMLTGGGAFSRSG